MKRKFNTTRLANGLVKNSAYDALDMFVLLYSLSMYKLEYCIGMFLLVRTVSMFISGNLIAEDYIIQFVKYAVLYFGLSFCFNNLFCICQLIKQ